MNKIYVVALVSLLGVGLAASVSYAAGTAGKSGFRTFDSHDLIGALVKNPQGKLLGVVDEVMITPDGQAFAIVTHGDDGLGRSYNGLQTPVPIAALRISETKSGKDQVVLNTDPVHLDLAPYLDPTRSSGPQFTANINRYFGIQPSWTEEGASSK